SRTSTASRKKLTTGHENLLASTRQKSYSWELAKKLHLELESTAQIKFFVNDSQTEFYSQQFYFDDFYNHSESHSVCTSPFGIEFDYNLLNSNISQLKANYTLPFREINKTQGGSKYFEVSKKYVIDDLAKPIIKVEVTPRRFVEPGTEVTLNASKTLSLSSLDTFSYDWDYLDG
uniref:hypothetical protein n=1 Tax=Candidatus Electronema sp. TaxID=2698783 RepID=UPI004055C946